MPKCNLYNSPIMNLQQIWCLTSDIKMQAIAFKNFSNFSEIHSYDARSPSFSNF